MTTWVLCLWKRGENGGIIPLETFEPVFINAVSGEKIPRPDSVFAGEYRPFEEESVCLKKPA
jgi:hypothetical protein